MYELHKQEEHKIRLPFCLAPEKPLDQNTCSVSMASIHVTKDEIKIINQNAEEEEGNEENYGAASAIVNQNHHWNSSE